MRTIHKYMIPMLPEFDLLMPEGAVFLSVQGQSGQAQSWWIVDTAAPIKPRRLSVIVTGQEIVTPGERLWYRGTFQLDVGAFVGHLFEVRPEAP